MPDTFGLVEDALIFNPKLAGLRPIYTPDPIPFEFMTPGWFILLGIIVLLCFFLIRNLFIRFQKNKYRREAIKNLQFLKRDISKNSPSLIIEKISSLLKLVSFKSYGREKTANLTGKQWSEFLCSRVKNKDNENDVFSLLELQYTTVNIKEDDLEKLIDVSCQWIRRHRV